ncbi:Hypothetical protein SMAX5B_014340 [Scophthalmus maximus]|uniref:Uncharacterized protein n=1 Tax=Scophthalmus maximus TaxID=52904 RepID=A0A2U9BH09_SCOMX|nr:Hypothetical protein SMAX5B_014340 [Scophthalmus maximus]
MWRSQRPPIPAVAQEVSDVWRGPPCTPVTQHSGERPSRADQGQSQAVMGDSVGTCPEHRPREFCSLLSSLLWPDPGPAALLSPGAQICVCSPTGAFSLQAVCALSCLFSGLAYRLEPVSARHHGPHTHTHYIPLLAARGEGEVLDEVNISTDGWDGLV